MYKLSTALADTLRDQDISYWCTLIFPSHFQPYIKSTRGLYRCSKCAHVWVTSPAATCYFERQACARCNNASCTVVAIEKTPRPPTEADIPFWRYNRIPHYFQKCWTPGKFVPATMDVLDAHGVYGVLCFFYCASELCIEENTTWFRENHHPSRASPCFRCASMEYVRFFWIRKNELESQA